MLFQPLPISFRSVMAHSSAPAGRGGGGAEGERGRMRRRSQQTFQVAKNVLINKGPVRPAEFERDRGAERHVHVHAQVQLNTPAGSGSSSAVPTLVVAAGAMRGRGTQVIIVLGLVLVWQIVVSHKGLHALRLALPLHRNGQSQALRLFVDGPAVPADNAAQALATQQALDQLEAPVALWIRLGHCSCDEQTNTTMSALGSGTNAVYMQ